MSTPQVHQPASIDLWWAAQERSHRAQARGRGECYECGEKLPEHASDCPNKPESEEDGE